MKIYTRTGDQGETGILGAGRVRKDDPRTEAYGAVDELNSFLGLVRAEALPPAVEDALEPVQHQLFRLGAQLASAGQPLREPSAVGPEHIRAIETAIDAAEAQLAPLTAFILPAGSRAAALLHVARAVCRRAERRVVSLVRHQPAVPADTIAYLNRLGDLLFVLARLANARAGMPDVPWRK